MAPAAWVWVSALTLTTHCDNSFTMTRGPPDDALWRHIAWRVAPALTTHYLLRTHCDDTLPDDALSTDDTLPPDDALWPHIALRCSASWRHYPWRRIVTTHCPPTTSGGCQYGTSSDGVVLPCIHLKPPLAATRLEYSAVATCSHLLGIFWGGHFAAERAASGCALPEMHGRLEISKNLASQEKRFFKVWKLDKSDLWYLMLAQDSQDHVAKRIPPMSQIAFFAHVWRDECVTTFINVNYTSNSAFQFPLSKARPQPRKTQYAFRKRLRMRPRRPKKKRRESPEQASTWKPALNENIDPSATDPQPQQSSAMSPRQNFQRNWAHQKRIRSPRCLQAHSACLQQQPDSKPLFDD